MTAQYLAAKVAGVPTIIFHGINSELANNFQDVSMKVDQIFEELLIAGSNIGQALNLTAGKGRSIDSRKII